MYGSSHIRKSGFFSARVIGVLKRLFFLLALLSFFVSTRVFLSYPGFTLLHVIKDLPSNVSMQR